MFFLLSSLIILLLNALVSKIFLDKNKKIILFTTCSSLLSLVVILFSSLKFLLVGTFAVDNSAINTIAVLPWTILDVSLDYPLFELNSISAFFLLPICILSILVTIYAYKYFQKKISSTHPINHNNNRTNNMASFWSAYYLLLASMVAVVLCKSNLLFLICWEIMGLSSFFLVLYENEKAETRRAAWIYLSITHIGTLAIISFFICSNLNDPSLRMFCLLLALIGFGSKAGIIPVHIWLPKAHALAPSPVSALMSGVMIKIGVYGFIRALIASNISINNNPFSNIDFNFSLVVLTVGMISGLGGILMALAQHDIKRLLAYCSVENIGVIYIGLGLGLMGLSTNNSTLAILGFSGGLLHVLNHAIFKGLLFLSAGAVISATHTHKMDKLGGLIKVMPLTAFTFFIGAISISGIPPFNGFISEFLIYFASFKTLSLSLNHPSLHTFTSNPSVIIFITLSILSLAIIGGLALFCFSKVFSIVFLGEMRSKEIAKFLLFYKHNQNADGGTLITLPQLSLSFLCILIGVFPMLVLPLLSAPIKFLTKINNDNVMAEFLSISNIFKNITLTFFIAASMLIILYLVRKRKRIKEGTTTLSPTWDCGYHAPTTRMQYSASSFTATLINFFNHFMYSKKELSTPTKYFWDKNNDNDKAHFHSSNLDLITELLYRFSYHKTLKFLSHFIRIQNGKINFYILYVIIFLIIMLIWSLLVI
ncbi:MAG: hypothetical protein HQK51_13990 [Oligoflexia bacterium]|nr:hypothetical protein [Oligoflexia bacterium]